MDRITIIALQRVISPLVSEQIRNIKQVQRVNLDPKDLEEKPDDSVMTREIKTQVKERLAENNKQLASHAVDIIDKAIEAEDKQKLDNLPKTKKWFHDRKKKEFEVSLSEYIRHSIHHPENDKNNKFSDKELKI